MTDKFNAELAEKKRRLAELRLARQQIAQERQAQPAQNGADGRASYRSTFTQGEFNEMRMGIGIASVGSESTQSVPSSSGANGFLSASLNAQFSLANGVSVTNAQPRPCNLEFLAKNAIAIPPKHDMVSYSKTTQTDDDRIYAGEFSMGSQELAFDDEMSLDENSVAPPVYDESPSREIRKHLRALQFNPNQTQILDLTEQHNDTTLTKVPDLSEEEKRQILCNSEFVHFFQQQARVMERAIAAEEEDDAIFADYINGSLHEEKIDKGELLVLNREISQIHVTENRMILAMDYSTFYPELLAVAYDRNPDQPLSPEGIVNVWNSRYKVSPEMTFHSSSQITSLLFDEFQSNIIIGGCYSGKICIWDTRVNKRNPVCRTQLGLKSHAQPIYCMKMVGSQNAHDLVTVSTDGLLCSWSVDNLQTPIDSIQLVCRSKKAKLTPATALCMSFFHTDINNFVIGSEENTLYIGDRHVQKGEISRSIEAHELPITAVDLHHVPGGSHDFTPLCLSGSMDYSVKLWDLKDSNPRQMLLLSLERKHKFYIVDVQWSPVHPAVFVSASADGMLNLWNLNSNIESPVATLNVSNSIRKVLWTKDGQRLTVGDANGRVYFYDVHESFYNVRASEFDDFAAILSELKAASSDYQFTTSI